MLQTGGLPPGQNSSLLTGQLQFLPIAQALLDLDGSLLSCLTSSQTA